MYGWVFEELVSFCLGWFDRTLLFHCRLVKTTNLQLSTKSSSYWTFFFFYSLFGLGSQTFSPAYEGACNPLVWSQSTVMRWWTWGGGCEHRLTRGTMCHWGTDTMCFFFLSFFLWSTLLFARTHLAAKSLESPTDSWWKRRGDGCSDDK